VYRSLDGTNVALQGKGIIFFFFYDTETKIIKWVQDIWYNTE